MTEPSHDILLITANSHTRTAMRAALESVQYQVREAIDGQSGFAQMTERLPDLAVIDLGLPDINGFDLASQLRALGGSANIPLLALTGFGANADELRIVTAEFTDYLFKPVDIPLLLKTVQSHFAPASEHAEKSGEQRRILAINDDPAQVKLLTLRLRQLGFVVRSATSAVDGLAQAREFRPAVIVSDVLMPGMDGFQFCMRVRDDPDLADIPVVLISSNYLQEPDKKLAQRIGANSLVQTEPDFHQAIQAIFASLGKSSPTPIEDRSSLEGAHQERLARQLDRQVQLNYELARRGAAQRSQISVLAQMGDKVLNGRIDRERLYGELLAQYIDGAGLSSGAMLIPDDRGSLALAATIGYSEAIAKSLPSLFAASPLLRDTILRSEPSCLTIAPNTDDPVNQLLSSINTETVLITPLRFGTEELGVIVLASQGQVVDSEWLSYSKAVTNQIAQVIALNNAIARLQYLASYDPLTQLPNRSYLHEQLRQAIAARASITLCLVNVDHFQEINNALSYRNGDLLLQQVAGRLSAGLPAGALVARLDADEFAILRHDIASVEDLHHSAGETLKKLEPTFQLAGLPVALRATMGVVVASDSGDDADTLLSQADMARRAARQTGHDYLIYPENVQPYDPDQIALLGELRQAIDSNGLMLYYQPKVNFKTGQTVGVEALIRWLHPARGWIPPDRFIPLAERAGLIHPITFWVVEAALQQSSAWRAQGIHLGIAVNISSHDLQDATFANFVTRLCKSTETSHRDLTFELTERSLMADPARAKSTLEEFNALGIRLSIDDFGTGYSALSYLQSLPVNEIKIDKSFITHFAADRRAQRIVRSIIDLGQGIGVSVVAEGIENKETWDVLGELGCDLGQGYYIARPMPACELAGWLEQSARRTIPPAAPLEGGV